MPDLTREDLLLDLDAMRQAGLGFTSVDVCLAQALKVVAEMEKPCPGHSPLRGVRFSITGVFYRWACEDCWANLKEALLR